MIRTVKCAAALLLCASMAVNGVPSGAVRRVATDEKIVALTFDDGPHPTETAKIVELLEKFGARATFFVIGENAEKYPDALRMVASNGHEIANHTYSHASLGRYSAQRIQNEISRAEDAVFSVSGVRPTLFRPPEGVISKSVVDAAHDMGYDVILWNIDTRDWAHRGTAEIVDNIKKNISPGSIILFHDYIGGERHTLDVLGIILPYLSSLGYEFVTVSEMMGKKTGGLNGPPVR